MGRGRHHFHGLPIAISSGWRVCGEDQRVGNRDNRLSSFWRRFRLPSGVRRVRKCLRFRHGHRWGLLRHAERSSICPLFSERGGGQALLKLDPTGKVLYASFVRQVVYTPAVLPSGTIQGITEDPYQGYNVSRIDLAATPKLNFSCPVNGASWRVPDGLAPGEIVSIFGSNLGPEAGAMGQLEANGRVSSSLAGTQVLFMAFRLHCCMHNPGRSIRLCRSRLIKLRRAW